MFDNLSEKLGGILDRLTRRGSLTEADVDAAMREVRRALLDADVSLDVVRSFTEKVREQAIGATVVKSVTPGQMVVKIVHDELIATLGSDGQTIDLNAVPPDAVNLARSFDERVGLTGIVLTRVDGDGRGGAALSMRAVTGKPIKLIGTGEKTDALEDFHPSRIAGRILGMGDVVSLVEKAAANIDAEKAARVAEKMRKGQFDLADMREQLMQMASMGGISGLMGMMPGIAKMKNQIANAGLDDKILKRQVAVIDSMTRQERKSPDVLKASRKKRIAAGAGVKVEDVNKLLKMHRNMADMMKAMGSGKRGPLAGIAQAMGFGGGMKPPSAEEMKALADKMQGGAGGGLPSLPKDLPPGLRTGLPNVPGLTGLSGKPMLPGLGGFPGKKK